MIAALFALAAAMAIGGCAAVIQGFPYVRLESGLAMVIAGTVAASSGGVLFGLGVVAMGLRRVERAAGRLPAGYSDGVSEAPAGPPPPSPAEGRPRLPPVLPPGPALAAPAAIDPRAFEPSVDAPPFTATPDPERARIESGLFARDHGPASAPSEPEPELPIPGLTPGRPAPEREPDPAAAGHAHDIAAEDDLFAAPGTEPKTGDAPDLPPLRPSLDAGPDSEPETHGTEKHEPAKPERTVVGRYASGGNTYVMFEDGAIEAETPQGRFTFSSLDELKAFVDGGGEAGTRGAA